MRDIAELLPKQSQTVKAIFDHYKSVGDERASGGHIKPSNLGHSCERFLWYQFRCCVREKFEGRMYRLFDTGNHEEQRFANDLLSIGCEVNLVDHTTGSQFKVESLGGHLLGYLDGCGLGIPEAPKTWHVLEFKTHSAKSFRDLVKKGVKVAKPLHYAQMQLYMGLTGMTRALYLAKNKDDDDLHSERVRFSEQEYLALMAVAERIRTSTAPPDRISTREDWYECSYCAAHQLCWGCPGPALPVPSISCRQCCHATATLDGNACWVCEKHKRGLSLTDQAAACPDHLVLPGLIGFAGPIDYSESGIVFENNDLTGRWNHGCGSGCFTTKELMQLEPKDLTNPLIEKTKEVFGAEVTKVSQDEILARYPKDSDTTRIVWGPAPIGLLKVEWMRRYNEDVESVTPVATGDGIDYKAAEYPGGRAVIVWTNMTMIGASNTEIRESVE